MKQSLALSGLFTVGLSLAAQASSFSLTGPAVPLFPTSAIGPDGSWNPGTPATSLPMHIGSSSVTAPNPVTRVTSIVLTGLSHTWIGDVQVVLRDPNGVGHNIFVRPGFGDQGDIYGNDGAFLGGTYTFVDPGTPGAMQLPTTWPAFDPPAGTYEQAFGAPADVWPTGNLGIDDAFLGTISGPAGAWTLELYDWFLGGDNGSITSWTMNGTDGGGGIPFCVPGTAGIIACPCGNTNGPGAGCANTGSGGASLSASGGASLASNATDPGSFVLDATNLFSGSTCIFLQGDASLAVGAPFGAGVRCVNGQLFRLYVKQGIVAGAKSAPVSGDRSVPNRAADLGTPIAPGSTRFYQIYYRDPGQSNPGAPCPANDTFNISTGLSVVWS